MQTEALYQAVLAAFKLNEIPSDDPTVAARAFTDILAAFAAVMFPPVTAEAVELAADVTPKLILAELQAQTAILRGLARHQRFDAIVTAPPLSTTQQQFVVGSNSPISPGDPQPVQAQSPGHP